MYKLNFLQYNNMQNLHINSELSLNILSDNQKYLELEKQFLSKYSFENINYFSFCKNGFLALLLELSKKGKIAISLGETQSLIDAANLFERLGFEIIYLELLKDGNVDLKKLQNQNIDFLFLSSYVMDTFVKTPLEEVKKFTSAKVISNASSNFDKNMDIHLYNFDLEDSNHWLWKFFVSTILNRFSSVNFYIRNDKSQNISKKLNSY